MNTTRNNEKNRFVAHEVHELQPEALNAVTRHVEALGWQAVTNYSGRAMFGLRCYGVSTPTDVELMEVVIAVSASLYVNGVTSEPETIGSSMDDDGLRQIVYFPILATGGMLSDLDFVRRLMGAAPTDGADEVAALARIESTGRDYRQSRWALADER